jgi:hypothetical protein
VAYAHFNIQYPMPLGPGADVSEVVLRAVEISSGEIGAQTLVGTVRGSSSCVGCMGGGLAGKKHCCKICVLWAGVLTSMLSMSQRGGKVLVGQPFRTLVRDHMSCALTAWWSLSCAQFCFV